MCNCSEWPFFCKCKSHTLRYLICEQAHHSFECVSDCISDYEYAIIRRVLWIQSSTDWHLAYTSSISCSARPLSNKWLPGRLISSFQSNNNTCCITLYCIHRSYSPRTSAAPNSRLFNQFYDLHLLCFDLCTARPLPYMHHAGQSYQLFIEKWRTSHFIYMSWILPSLGPSQVTIAQLLQNTND